MKKSTLFRSTSCIHYVKYPEGLDGAVPRFRSSECLPFGMTYGRVHMFVAAPEPSQGCDICKLARLRRGAVNKSWKRHFLSLHSCIHPKCIVFKG